MAFFTILLAIMATFSYQIMAQPPKCSLDDSEMEFFSDVSYIASEIQQQWDPTLGVEPKDTELNMCPDGTGVKGKGPAVTHATWLECQSLPQICKLDDGTFYFYDYVKKCFRTYDSVKYPWGINGTNDALGVYTSIGAKDIDMGTTFEIKELINATLPNATIPHNGCVRVDNICQNCKSCNNIVLYVGTESNSEAFSWPSKVTVLKKKCIVLEYVE